MRIRKGVQVKWFSQAERGDCRASFIKRQMHPFSTPDFSSILWFEVSAEESSAMKWTVEEEIHANIEAIAPYLGLWAKWSRKVTWNHSQIRLNFEVYIKNHILRPGSKGVEKNSQQIAKHHCKTRSRNTNFAKSSWNVRDLSAGQLVNLWRRQKRMQEMHHCVERAVWIGRIQEATKYEYASLHMP